MWHSRPHWDPPLLHGKNHLKLSFWLFEPFPKIHCIGGFLHGVINIWAVQALSDQACHAHYITIWEQSYFASIRWFVFGKSQTPKMVCLRNTKSWWRDRLCFILDSKLPAVMMVMMLVKVARMSSIPVWKLPVDMRIPSVHSRLLHILDLYSYINHLQK